MGAICRRYPKSSFHGDFSSYETSIDFLRSSLQRISANMSSPQRTFPYEWMGTHSRGYDSPTCVALAQEAGLRTTLSFSQSRPGVQDDGHALAEVLGVTCKGIDRLGWTQQGIWEPVFLAADGQGKEIMTASANDCLSNRVLLTGHGGDYTWALNPKPLTPDLPRGSYSGLSLCEFRLHSGFLHLPVPFMGISQVGDISQITRSPSMALWDTGGKYSRPICRRVLEERGVAGELFGKEKTGASVRFAIGQDPWSSQGRNAFLTWMRTELPLSQRSSAITIAWLRLVMRSLQLCLLVGGIAPGGLGRIIQLVADRHTRYLRRCGIEDFAFLWGIARVRFSYPNNQKFGGGSPSTDSAEK